MDSKTLNFKRVDCVPVAPSIIFPKNLFGLRNKTSSKCTNFRFPCRSIYLRVFECYRDLWERHSFYVATVRLNMIKEFIGGSLSIEVTFAILSSFSPILVSNAVTPRITLFAARETTNWRFLTVPVLAEMSRLMHFLSLSERRRSQHSFFFYPLVYYFLSPPVGSTSADNTCKSLSDHDFGRCSPCQVLPRSGVNLFWFGALF